MFWKSILCALFLFFLISCSNTNNTLNSNEQKIFSPETKYVEAMKKFNNEQYQEAIIAFENIEKIYPLSNEAIQSQIMSGFIDYILLDYETAILKFSKLINKYPSLKNIDYVYYMRALCYYEQISHEGLDGEYNSLALENLNQVINRFPKSKYAKDSYQKLVLVKSNIAAKHMTIGRFYQKNKKYTAALNRYKIVIDEFDETKFIAEALYRTSEIYYSIGMVDEARKAAAILGHNYPKSDWYELSYENIMAKEEKSIFRKSVDKIFNK